MTKQLAHDDLADRPLISKPALGQVHNVGVAAVNAAAERLGLKPRRLVNGRELLSYTEAQQISRELIARIH
jgi:hypothetical protein